ncbi:MAG: MATE family efflux transporter, partial [Parasporobacterium sp.]|nr:MATE family efflux transporter [Parasporobacterium sp.]
MYTNKDLRDLLIPLIVEQILSAFMGIADTFMVSNVSQEALSGVSLVDTINNVMVTVMMAMAASGTVVCAQYLGRKDDMSAKQAAGQVIFCGIAAAVVPTCFCMIFTSPLLKLLYGGIEADVMKAASDYFLITALSYPFFALQLSNAAILRAEGETRLPMYVSLGTNLLNIAGNALLIFGLGLGVRGAAFATLCSRFAGAVILQVSVSTGKRILRVDSAALLLPKWRFIRLILRLGIPNSFENGMFRFGKLIVASTVSTLGTAAISAQAMIQLIEGIHGYPGEAVGTGLMTVAGTCMGAGKPEEAKKYTRKLLLIAECCMLVMALLIAFSLKPVVIIASLSEEAAGLFIRIMILSLFVKSVLWVCSFVLPNTLRAAGDAMYCSVVSAASMWVFRVGMSYVLCRHFGVGLVGVWIGWYTD